MPIRLTQAGAETESRIFAKAYAFFEGIIFDPHHLIFEELACPQGITLRLLHMNKIYWLNRGWIAQ